MWTAALLVAGCSSTKRSAEPARPDPDGSAQILRGSELGGNLLDALRTRVQNISVTSTRTGCPRITFRGRRSGGNPSIYIDGTLIADTCVLANLSSSEVDFVEVYRSGTSRRAGIRSNPNGLILVFRVR